MNKVLSAAGEVQSICTAQGWRFCFIGGLAVLRWGDPRETVDVDLTLITGFGAERPYILELLRHFARRIRDAEKFATDHRVLLLQSHSGVGLDISLGALPYEEQVVARSSELMYPGGIPLRTCSAEDLVVLKAFAGRTRDWSDIERIIVRQTGRLDWDYVLRSLAPLAEIKGDTDLLDRLMRCRDEFESP